MEMSSAYTFVVVTHFDMKRLCIKTRSETEVEGNSDIRDGNPNKPLGGLILGCIGC